MRPAPRAAEPKPVRPIARPRKKARAIETSEKPPKPRAATTRGRHNKVQKRWVEVALAGNQKPVRRADSRRDGVIVIISPGAPFRSKTYICRTDQERLSCSHSAKRLKCRLPMKPCRDVRRRSRPHGSTSST